MSEDMATWLYARLDEQQHWNEGTGIAAWLTYLDADGRLLDTRLAAATELDPEHWTLDGDDAPHGWTHVNVVHDERAVRAEITAKRAILSLHEHSRQPIIIRAINQRANHGRTAGNLWRCAVCHPTGGGGPERGWCQTVRHLGEPYEDQAGYRAEWRPVSSG